VAYYNAVFQNSGAVCKREFQMMLCPCLVGSLLYQNSW